MWILVIKYILAQSSWSLVLQYCRLYHCQSFTAMIKAKLRADIHKNYLELKLASLSLRNGKPKPCLIVLKLLRCTNRSSLTTNSANFVLQTLSLNVQKYDCTVGSLVKQIYSQVENLLHEHVFPRNKFLQQLDFSFSVHNFGVH